MMRTKLTFSALAAAGATMIAAGVLGTGTAATASTSTSTYQLTYGFDAYTGLTKVARWAPCLVLNGVKTTHVINYKVRTAGVASRVTLVKNAMSRVASATGLHFHYAGTTSYIPQGKSNGTSMLLDAARQRKATHAQLVIAWAWAGTGTGRSNLLSGTEAGVGSISWASSSTSQLRIGDAAVVMRRGVHLLSGFVAGGSTGTLLLHELGHAMGLQHVSYQREVMYPIVSALSPGGYTTGDKQGLYRVGAAMGCFRTPNLPPVSP
ncbi:MAG TPA: matrixin family metalloprotease [Mycobacteriales bacterium]|nr:matrixin family metalloprotease [Mycobacteriales bacterium]